jgi:hypothetical protein
VSRWLTQQVQPQYPNVVVLEALEAEYGSIQVSQSTCDSWVYKNSVGHPVLRDTGGQGSIAKNLGLKLKNFVIVDRYLKIVFKGPVTTTLDQNQVLNILNQLK